MINTLRRRWTFNLYWGSLFKTDHAEPRFIPVQATEEVVKQHFGGDEVRLPKRFLALFASSWARDK